MPSPSFLRRKTANDAGTGTVNGRGLGTYQLAKQVIVTVSFASFAYLLGPRFPLPVRHPPPLVGIPVLLKIPVHIIARYGIVKKPTDWSGERKHKKEKER